MAPCRSARVLLVALALVAAPLAGCLGADGDGSAASGPDEQEASAEPLYASLEAALEEPGATFPAEDADLELKLLSPPDTGDVEVATHNVTLALYTPGENAPVEDANVTLNTRMPAMGHGTSPEEDPTHDAHGVYQGLTNIAMDGRWVLDLTATVDGETAEWSIELLAGDAAEGQHPLAETVHHRWTETYEGTADGVDHLNNWTFPVNATGAGLHVNASLEDPTALDELELVLRDPEGGEVAAATLSEAAPETNLSVRSAPANGTFDAGIEGRGLDTAYTIDVVVVWTTVEVDR